MMCTISCNSCFSCCDPSDDDDAEDAEMNQLPPDDEIRFVEPCEVLKNAQLTDLIEFRYKNVRGTHWGMYVGNNTVIHLSHKDGGSGKVVETELNLVAQDGQCRIKNVDGEQLLDLEGKQDFTKHSRKPEDIIIMEARWWLSPDQNLKYLSKTGANNSHYLCIKWKYGISKNGEISRAAGCVAKLSTKPID